MSDRDDSPPRPSPAATERRRSSISAATLADLFSRPSYNGSSAAATTSTSPPSYPGPITTAAAQAQRRRLSLTTLGLSASPNQSSPFNQGRSRGESISSATSGSVDESPFEDDAPGTATSMPPTPFARRLSFGARALRDVRAGGNGNVGNANGEGFNFADSVRSRAERASVSGPSMPSPVTQHHRAKSVAAMEPPIREVPKPPKAPDAFQERILKGDFYMD